MIYRSNLYMIYLKLAGLLNDLLTGPSETASRELRLIQKAAAKTATSV